MLLNRSTTQQIEIPINSSEGTKFMNSLRQTTLQIQNKKATTLFDRLLPKIVTEMSEASKHGLGGVTITIERIKKNTPLCFRRHHGITDGYDCLMEMVKTRFPGVTTQIDVVEECDYDGRPMCEWIEMLITW